MDYTRPNKPPDSSADAANSVDAAVLRLHQQRTEAVRHAGPEADDIPRPDEEGGDDPLVEKYWMMESDTQTTTRRVMARWAHLSEGFKEEWRVQQQIFSRRDQAQRDRIRAAGIVRRRPVPAVAPQPTVALATPEPAVAPHLAVVPQQDASPYILALRQRVAEVKRAAWEKAEEERLLAEMKLEQKKIEQIEEKRLLAELAEYGAEPEPAQVETRAPVWTDLANSMHAPANKNAVDLGMRPGTNIVYKPQTYGSIRNGQWFVDGKPLFEGVNTTVRNTQANLAINSVMSDAYWDTFGDFRYAVFNDSLEYRNNDGKVNPGKYGLDVYTELFLCFQQFLRPGPCPHGNGCRYRHDPLRTAEVAVIALTDVGRKFLVEYKNNWGTGRPRLTGIPQPPPAPTNLKLKAELERKNSYWGTQKIYAGRGGPNTINRAVTAEGLAARAERNQKEKSMWWSPAVKKADAEKDRKLEKEWVRQKEIKQLSTETHNGRVRSTHSWGPKGDGVDEATKQPVDDVEDGASDNEF